MSSCKRTTQAPGIGATYKGRKIVGFRRIHDPDKRLYSAANAVIEARKVWGEVHEDRWFENDPQSPPLDLFIAEAVLAKLAEIEDEAIKDARRGQGLWYFVNGGRSLLDLRFRFRHWRRRRSMIAQLREWGGRREHIRSYMRTGDSGNIPVYPPQENDNG
jgi:hypothetical protein